MSESHDKILEAFLNEMLCQQHPGRDAGEIVRRVQACLSGAADENPVPLVADGAELPVAATRVVQLGPGRQPAEADRPIPWLSVLGLAACLLVTTGLLIWFLLPESAAPPAIADFPGAPSGGAAELRETEPPAGLADKRTAPRRPRDSRPDREPEPVVDDSRVAKRTDIPADQTALVMPPPFVRNVSLNVAPQTPDEAARDIDTQLIAGWQQAGLQPVGRLELDNWATRLSTRVLGRTPTAAEKVELNQLVASGQPFDQVRVEIVDWLMSREEFPQQFSEFWGRALAWKMLGLGPSLQTTDADMLRTKEYLSEQIVRNQALDAVVYDLISAVGSTNPERPDFKPSASYLVGLTKRFGQRELATAHIADTFLGQSIQCAQCHDSVAAGRDRSLAEFDQSQFYRLHAFFDQLRFEPVGDDGFYVVNRNYLPNGQLGQVEAPCKYTDLTGAEHEVFPGWGDLQPEPNGFVAIVDRRSQLAAAIVVAPEFRNSMVNVVWTALLNVPLTGIDDSGETTAAEQQIIRDQLASQWAANNYQLPWLVRTIVLTEAFAVGVGTDEQLAANNPFLGAAPRFNQFYQRLENRRSAASSLAIVAGAYQSRDPAEAQSAGLLARIDGPRGGTPPPRVIQAWLPSNDNQWATSPAVTRQLDAIAASEMSAELKIRHLVQAALGRQASPAELTHGTRILESADDQRIALQDIWWGLLNSVEYQLPLAMR